MGKVSLSLSLSGCAASKGIHIQRYTNMCKSAHLFTVSAVTRSKHTLGLKQPTHGERIPSIRTIGTIRVLMHLLVMGPRASIMQNVCTTYSKTSGPHQVGRWCGGVTSRVTGWQVKQTLHYDETLFTAACTCAIRTLYGQIELLFRASITHANICCRSALHTPILVACTPRRAMRHKMQAKHREHALMFLAIVMLWCSIPRAWTKWKPCSQSRWW